MADYQPPPIGENGGDVTLLLQAYARGNHSVLNSLIERVYAELRSIASGRLRNESQNSMMGPTALVNEAYLRLFGGHMAGDWDCRGHFFAAASETMRRILVDQARSRLAQKRGGGSTQQELAEFSIVVGVPDETLLDVDAALDAFSQYDPEKANLVKLRFFVGLSENEAAATLGVSRATASRYWTFAKAWLFDWLRQRNLECANFQEKAETA